MLTYTDINGKIINPKISTFPGGEEYVKIIDNLGIETTINGILNNSSKIMQLFMLINSMRVINPIIKITLNIPYLPYARQDRVCSIGESFSLKVFADMLNSLNLYKIIVRDVHSNIAMNLINNLENESQDYYALHNESFMMWLQDCKVHSTYILCPDNGAIKRTEHFYDVFNHELDGIIYANKVRKEDGSIHSEITSIPESMKGTIGHRILIVDDICDGGKTFTGIAEKLKPYKLSSLALFVTHGIFSNGKEVLSKAGFTNIFDTYNFK